MVLELAEITIRPGEQAQFDAAIAQGIAEVISHARGFRRATVHNGMAALLVLAMVALLRFLFPPRGSGLY